MTSRFLVDAVVRHLSPYSAILPYNLNWMLRSCEDPIFARCGIAPITVVDVGCRGGLPDELRPLRKLIHHIGFDADKAECDHLSPETHGLCKQTFYPLFVGAEDGESDFHLYKSRGDSSALLPDPRFTKLFGGSRFAVEKTTRVRTTTLDSFFRSNPELPRPDMIKLDTQGTELGILKGAEDCLRTASLVEVEVEFIPHYTAQSLFEEVLAYMRRRGFELFFLNRVFQQRNGYSGWGKGQLSFGDALFARREDCLDGLDDKAICRYLILLVNYGYLDVVHSIIENAKLSTDIKQSFSLYLARRSGWRVTRFVRRVASPAIDKIILLLLHARKHNARAFDSDRSWPFR